MRAREMKDGVYEQFARLGKAMSAPKRLELLDLLCQGPRTVEALAEQAALSVANASQHLQVLRDARLVEAEKKGLYVEYRLADEEVLHFFMRCASSRAARFAEVEHVTETSSELAARWNRFRATSCCGACARARSPCSTCAPRGVPRRPHPGRALDAGRASSSAGSPELPKNARSSRTAAARTA